MNKEKRDISYYKSISEKISREISILKKIPVRENYFLILGGGKFGTIALDYAIKKKFQNILIIDKNEETLDNLSMKHQNIKCIHDVSEYFSIFSSLFQKNSETIKTAEIQNHSEFIYFWATELENLPIFLYFGIPAYIIPTIPVHVAAFFIKILLNFPMSNLKSVFNNLEGSKAVGLKNPVILKNLPIPSNILDQNNNILSSSIPSSFFEKFLNLINPEVILSSDRSTGTILLSYAKENEICPNNCMGPPDYCPHFKRIKPKTITEIAQDLIMVNKKIGWVFESNQIHAGLGGFLGFEFKKKVVECLVKIDEYFSNHINIINDDLKSLELDDEYKFFVATTCNCHGVLTIFSF